MIAGSFLVSFFDNSWKINIGPKHRLPYRPTISVLKPVIFQLTEIETEAKIMVLKLKRKLFLQNEIVIETVINNIR